MALYIVLEKEVPGLDAFVNGKAVGRAEKQLAAMAQRRGVRSLMEFFSVNPDEAADFLEGEGLDDVKIPSEQWFSPQEGLATVLTLLDEVATVPELGDVKTDLLEFKRVLQQAQAQGVRWHLAVDV
jgi:hypothetical protein